MPRKKAPARRAPSRGLSPSETLFETGPVYYTQAIKAQVAAAALQTLLRKHSRGDWGKPVLTSKSENERNAKKNSGRISSAHLTPTKLGLRSLWVVTEGGPNDPPRRTLVLFPEEN